MILPVVAYGHSVLKHVAEDIKENSEELQTLIADMFETMYYTEGVGLAAPQINKSIRLFVIDTDPFKEKYPEGAGVKKVFINAQIEELSGEPWIFKEGCLSLPDMGEDVERPSIVRISYLDENWVKHEDTFDGIVARVIQHEYDHLEGQVFIDHISNIRRQLISGKLKKIVDGKIRCTYRTRGVK